MTNSFSTKCAPFGQISIFLTLVLANILVLIVLTDSAIKILCYKRPCGVNFEKYEIFKFLRGPKGGGSPEKLSPLYEKWNNTITYLQGKKHPPPVGNGDLYIGFAKPINGENHGPLTLLQVKRLNCNRLHCQPLIPMTWF